MSSVFNGNTFTGGAYVYLYENQEQSVEQLIQQALVPYITTSQAITLFVSKSAFDNSFNEIINIVNGIDSSLNVIVSRLDDVDVCLNQLSGEIGILDNSLNNEIIRNDNQDISINQLSEEISILDNSLNNLQTSVNTNTGNITINTSDINELNNEFEFFINNLITLTNIINTKVSKTGDSMNGILNMNNNKIENIGVPTNNNDATNKQYVDDVADLKLNLTGGTMTGDLIVNGRGRIAQTSPPAQLQNSRLFVQERQQDLNINKAIIGLNFVDLNNNNCNISLVSRISGIPYIGTNSNHSFALVTNNAFRMTVLNNGNVGIGTTNPSGKLHVNGNSKVNGTLELSNGTASNHAITKSQLDAIETKFEDIITGNFTRTRLHTNRLSTDTGGGVFTQHTLESRKLGAGTYNVTFSIVFFSTFNTTVRFLVEAFKKNSTPFGDDKVITPFLQRDADTTFAGGIITNGVPYTIVMPFTYTISPGDIINNNNIIETKVRPDPSSTTSGHEIRFNFKITTEKIATKDF